MFTAIQSYFRKQEKSQINNLILHLRQQEKQTESNDSRRKKNHKDDIKKKNEDKENNTKDQWNLKLVLSQEKTDKNFSQPHQEKREKTHINKI